MGLDRSVPDLPLLFWQCGIALVDGVGREAGGGNRLHGKDSVRFSVHARTDCAAGTDPHAFFQRDRLQDKIKCGAGEIVVTREQHGTLR